IHACARNHVPRKRCAQEVPWARGVRPGSVWIVNGDRLAAGVARLREIAVQLRQGRHTASCGHRLKPVQAFVREEEERPVFGIVQARDRKWPTESGSELAESNDART